MKLRLTPPAEADIRDIYEWYGEQDLELPAAFKNSLDQTFRQLLQHPLGHPRVHADVRRVLLRRFPYCVYYIVADPEIAILGVFHGRRDPSVWKSRADA